MWITGRPLVGMIPHGHQKDGGWISRTRPSCHCGLSDLFYCDLSKIWVRCYMGQIQSGCTDTILGKIVLSPLFTSCSGLIKCLKQGNKEKQFMVDFPTDACRSQPLLVLFCSVFSGVIWQKRVNNKTNRDICNWKLSMKNCRRIF